VACCTLPGLGIIKLAAHAAVQQNVFASTFLLPVNYFDIFEKSEMKNR